ncbi:unnamed protein product [Sphenostylis stenocarpa]|uniref:Uncharacterized protein n=1 Tax=Sphenostylis stenocarpa TaxID=92480 RepID=A0AA86VX08_9FABA|nr:unnamed protein product [Sphenostylis stenocarpa]
MPIEIGLNDHGDEMERYYENFTPTYTRGKWKEQSQIKENNAFVSEEVVFP